ncbi:MAG: hypothetical protein ISR78_00130 [Spirochaetia bacterium]|nr:hypothetical protein [Spirochaetia bacterium]
MYHLPADLAGKLEPWQGDIYFLENVLPNLHKNIYHSLTKEKYHQNIQKLKEECTDLEPEQRWVKIREFTTSIGDAHTAYSSIMTDAFPLNLVVLKDGVFVTASLEEHRNLVRIKEENPTAAEVELIAINGIPIFSPDSNKHSDNSGVYSLKAAETVSVFSILTSILSHENEGYVRSLMSSALLDPQLLYGAGIISSREACEMTFRFPGGESETIYFESRKLITFKDLNWVVFYDDTYPADRTLLPPYLQYSKDMYRGVYYPSEKLLYILYNSCKNDPEHSFSNFISKQYSDLEGHPIDNVVVDLRNNSGGDSRIIKPLYSLLYNELSQSRLFIIIGPNTFSSGLMNAVELSQKFNGILVGSPTGGKPNHYGEVRSTQLPSGNIISWSTNYFIMIPGDNSDALYPDLPVENESADFFALKDSVLETIFLQNR